MAKKKPKISLDGVKPNVFALALAVSRAMFYGGDKNRISEMEKEVIRADTFEAGVKAAKKYVDIAA